MQKTGIEYLTHTWNPIAMRCTPASIGCANCWHLRTANRLSKNPAMPLKEREALAGTGPFVLRERELSAPLRTRKPAVIGVQFMGDLFHEDVPDEFIDQVHAVMLGCKTLENVAPHTFLVLTKRSDRMASYYSADRSDLFKRWAEAGDGLITMDDEDILFSEFIAGLTCFDWDDNGYNYSKSEYKPMGYFNRVEPDIWHGLTICNQQEADAKIPDFLRVPGKKFISYEPALGPVDFRPFLGFWQWSWQWSRSENFQTWVPHDLSPIDLIIAGAETGPGARPMHPDWVRSVRDQCAASGVHFYLKQNGEWIMLGESGTYMASLVDRKTGRYYLNGDRTKSFQCTVDDNGSFARVGTKRAGRLLDGIEHNALPWREP